MPTSLAQELSLPFIATPHMPQRLDQILHDMLPLKTIRIRLELQVDDRSGNHSAGRQPSANLSEIAALLARDEWLEETRRLDEEMLIGIGEKLSLVNRNGCGGPAAREVTLAVIQRFTRNWIRYDVKLPPNGRAVYRGVLMSRAVAGRVVLADVRHVLAGNEHLNTTQLFEAARDIERGAWALWLGDVT